MSKLNRGKTYKSDTRGTAKQLVDLHGSRKHDCNFKRILPSAMDKLVAEGLFVRVGDSYQITALGLQRSKELESS